jgi:TPR repeat protein
MTRAIPLFFMLLSLLAAPVSAADFEEGCEAFDRGDFERAMREWEPLADQGHPAAQFRLGCLYVFGHGVDKDYAKALDLYLEAARAGDLDAQSNLGSMYALGWGTEVDRVEAYKWLELAARDGHEMAIANRDFLAETMGDDEIAEAVARAEAFAAARATN